MPSQMDPLPDRECQLRAAVKQQDLAAVQRLLEEGAAVSAADTDGMPALHLAAAAVHSALVQALLAAGADPSADKDLGCQQSCQRTFGTPLLYMLQQQCKERGLHQCGPQCAAVAGVVQQLVAAGAQTQVAGTPTDRTTEGFTPLHYAAAAGCGTVVRGLLEAGADASSATPPPGMYTVLHAAASSGNHEVMQQVLSALGSKAQAKLRYLGQRGAGGSTCHTPLHLAAAGGNYTMVQMLLAAGADVGRRDSQGSMPLHRAAAAGHLEVVRALVAAGADLDSQDAGKATPLHLAAAGGHTEVARVLVAAGAGLDSQGAHSDTPLHLAAEGGHTEVTQVLVAAGAGLDRQGRYKATPLHLAAAWGHKEVAQALVAAGADRDLQDAFGDMPLHKALAAHRHQLVPLLVTPSNVNHAVRGDAALHIAATAAAKGVALLLAAGACLTDRNDKGLTALAVAAGDGCTAALHVLLQHHLQQHSSRSQLLAVLQEAADQALSRGGRRQWSLLATTAMGVLGEEGLHSLWRTYKQRATDTEHPHFAVSIRPSCTLEAWIELWTSGCSELATQRSRITGRLQQLVMNPQQQQQQAQPEQQLEAASPAGFLQAGNSARAVCGFGTESAPDPLLAPNAAEDGSEEQVQAAAKLAGLSAAAVAAVEGGDWGLTMRLLRQLEAEDATKAKQAVRAVHAAVSKQQLLLLLQQQQQQQQQQQLQAEAGAAAEVEEDDSSDDAWRKEQEEENRRHTADLTAAVQVADALLPDWLGTQRQRPQELRDAVLAAVERVGAAACF